MNLPGRNVRTSTTPKDATTGEHTTEIELHPAIGMTVVVATADGGTARGLIVDDFGDLAGTPVGIGTDRVARARRWAVDIDGGHIVFVDDAELLELHLADSDSDS